ncbi:hypothetical protein CORC01_10856 [Colletotrichum orchidophilum]|uniref:Uncharacterized protein n=1 Tax=Colletotrichum orchidophilum TaxID=1209926 RepID=A0A1G4AXJ6_9PEZI|nr:uncharacterized protein CORC01_10856 [Colletotrichum orchidophilum]OHE93835.1 hypothetical protein CORC01_10856 [Colletotrichum orchidophilum]
MYSSLRNAFLFSFFILAATASFSLPKGFATKCPTYIDTVVPLGQDDRYGRREPGDPFLATMRDVHNTLSDCDSIKSLKLRVASIGCSEHPDRWNFPLDLASGSKYPSKLESLDLEGYHFGDRLWEELQQPPYRTNSRFWDTMEWMGSGRAWKWARYLPLSAEQKAKTNLELWLDAMDFGHIKEFALRPTRGHHPDVARLVPHLTSLRSLKVYGAWAQELIVGVPENSLTHLSWIFSGVTGASVLPILRHHAQSLKSLEWREAESGIRQRRVMTAEEISELGRMAPNLEKITLDINRNGTWPMEHFDALVTEFPKVTNVTIFLEIASECRRQLGVSKEGMGPYEQWKMDQASPDCSGGMGAMEQPLLTRSHAAELFEHLREKKVGDALRKVVFYAGDWERPWDGALAEGEWLDGRKAFFVCEAVDDGESRDGPGSNVVQCLGMNTHVATRGRWSGYDEEDGPLDNPEWRTDLAQRAIRMEL